MKWIGEPPAKCDIGGEPIEKIFFDGATKLHGIVGPWAFMCPHCFARDGVGLGTGRGQKYELQPDGSWLKTGG